MSSEPKPSGTQANKKQIYLWMPISPEYMIKKPEPGATLYVTSHKEGSQILLDDIRKIIPDRIDLPRSPFMLSYDAVMEFAKHAGYGKVRVMDYEMDIPIS